MIFGWFSNRGDATVPRTLPTVRFDASRVSDVVKADLWEQINAYEDLPYGEEQVIYEAALRSIMAGGAMSILAKALIEMGVPKGRAGSVAIALNNRATSIMNDKRATDMGITEAKWSYSGAPCFVMRNPPTVDELRRDAAHKAANGKRYKLAEGMLMDGRREFPGREPGCKCVSRPLVPGID